MASPGFASARLRLHAASARSIASAALRVIQLAEKRGQPITKHSAYEIAPLKVICRPCTKLVSA